MSAAARNPSELTHCPHPVPTDSAMIRPVCVGTETMLSATAGVRTSGWLVPTDHSASPVSVETAYIRESRLVWKTVPSLTIGRATNPSSV